MKRPAILLGSLVLSALASAPAFADTFSNTQQQSTSLSSSSTIALSNFPYEEVYNLNSASDNLSITFSNFGIAPTDQIDSASISFSISGPNGEIGATASEAATYSCSNYCPYLSNYYAYSSTGSAYVSAPGGPFASAGLQDTDLLADGFGSDLLNDTPITLADGVSLSSPSSGYYYFPGAYGGSTWNLYSSADYTLTATLNVTYSTPPPPSPTPEPSSLLLLGTSLLGSAAILRRRLDL